MQTQTILSISTKSLSDWQLFLCLHPSSSMSRSENRGREGGRIGQRALKRSQGWVALTCRDNLDAHSCLPFSRFHDVPGQGFITSEPSRPCFGFNTSPFSFSAKMWYSIALRFRGPYSFQSRPCLDCPASLSPSVCRLKSI